MLSGSLPDYDYLTLLYDVLLKSRKGESQFARENTQDVFEQYIAEAKNQGLNTDSLNDIDALCDFHLKNIVNKTEALSLSPVTPQPQPSILPMWMSSFIIGIIGSTVEKPLTLPVDFIENIPDDIFLCIALQLQLPELMRFTQTSKKFWGLFQPQLNGSNYLSYVMNADKEGANRGLMELKVKYPNNYWQYVLRKVRGTELCERKWHSVSPLEHAAWVGDMFMVDMLLAHIPTEDIQEALKQLLAVKNHGLEHGPRMAPFYALIEAYKNNKHWEGRSNDSCVEEIKALQYQLSCFGLQWICDISDAELSDTTFSFDREPQRTFILNGNSWDPFYSSTRDTFSFSYWRDKARQDSQQLAAARRGRFIAFENLCQVSSNQLDQTIASLQERIAATSQPQPKK